MKSKNVVPAIKKASVPKKKNTQVIPLASKSRLGMRQIQDSDLEEEEEEEVEDENSEEIPVSERSQDTDNEEEFGSNDDSGNIVYDD
jgi:hypothetical protein